MMDYRLQSEKNVPAWFSGEAVTRVLKKCSSKRAVTAVTSAEPLAVRSGCPSCNVSQLFMRKYCYTCTHRVQVGSHPQKDKGDPGEITQTLAPHSAWCAVGHGINELLCCRKDVAQNQIPSFHMSLVFSSLLWEVWWHMLPLRALIYFTFYSFDYYLHAGDSYLTHLWILVPSIMSGM